MTAIYSEIAACRWELAVRLAEERAAAASSPGRRQRADQSVLQPATPKLAFQDAHWPEPEGAAIGPRTQA